MPCVEHSAVMPCVEHSAMSHIEHSHRSVIYRTLTVLWHTEKEGTQRATRHLEYSVTWHTEYSIRRRGALIWYKTKNETKKLIETDWRDRPRKKEKRFDRSGDSEDCRYSPELVWIPSAGIAPHQAAMRKVWPRTVQLAGVDRTLSRTGTLDLSRTGTLDESVNGLRLGVVRPIPDIVTDGSHVVISM